MDDYNASQIAQAIRKNVRMPRETCLRDIFLSPVQFSAANAFYKLGRPRFLFDHEETVVRLSVRKETTNR